MSRNPRIPEIGEVHLPEATMNHAIRQESRTAAAFSLNPRIAIGGSILGGLLALDLIAALILGRLT